MAKIRMIKEIKETFPYYLVLIKTGTFYKEYGKDSIIMNYLFDFKVKYDSVSDIEGVDKIQDAGFPQNSLEKVTAKLEQNRINYIVIDRNENYREVEKMDYRDKNKYQEIFLKSIERYDLKFYLENQIIKKIDENFDNPKMKDILIYIADYLKENIEGEKDGKKTN